MGVAPAYPLRLLFRDITVERLIASLIQVVAQDRLFNAVLDDGR